MPIFLYLIIIIVFVAKAVSKSSSQNSRRPAGAGTHAGASARGRQYAAGGQSQSRRPADSTQGAQVHRPQPRRSQVMRRVSDNPAAAYSYNRKGFSYSSLKPSEDGLEVLMRRNREREKELEKRIQ